jgi:hypothetical protein
MTPEELIEAHALQAAGDREVQRRSAWELWAHHAELTYTAAAFLADLLETPDADPDLLTVWRDDGWVVTQAALTMNGDPVWVRTPAAMANDRRYEVFTEVDRWQVTTARHCRVFLAVAMGLICRYEPTDRNDNHWGARVGPYMQRDAHSVMAHVQGAPTLSQMPVSISDLVLEVPPTHTCPTNDVAGLVGCGRTFAVYNVVDDEGFVDCPHCGLFFMPQHPNNRERHEPQEATTA